MLVALLLFASVHLAPAPMQQQQLPTANLAEEAKTIERLRTKLSGGDPDKASEINFWKRAQTDRVYDNFSWYYFAGKVTYTIAVGRHNPDFYVDKTPAWAQKATVLGFDAAVARVGVVRKDEDETWSTAGCWVAAEPYAISVDAHASPDTPSVWKTQEWTEYNAKAREIAEAAIQLLSGAGYIQMGDLMEGSLVVTAQSNTGANIGNLKIQLDVPGKDPLIVTTDGSGRVKVAVPVVQPDRDLVGKAVACTYTEATKVGGVPLYVVGALRLEFETTFKLAKSAEFKGTLDLKFYVRPVYVRVEHSDSSDAVTECTVSLHSGDISGPAILRVYERAGVPRDASGALVLRVPVTRSNGGTPAAVYAAAKVKGVFYEGWENITLPSNTVESAAAIIELNPVNFLDQFAKYRKKIEDALTAAGCTKEEIQQIRALKIRIGDRNNYRDGVIQLAPNSKLKDSSENLLHEYGHFITDIIAQDEPEGVGIIHDVDAPVNLEAAWDEGRAHFYSTLLGQITGLPGSKPIATSPSGVSDCENRELFIQRALIEHFGNKALYATPIEALKAFRDVQAHGRQQMERPPRTIYEFLTAAGTTSQMSQAQKDDLERIRNAYGFNPK